VETGDGPLVLEVSAFGGFRGLFSSQSMNAAQKLADYVIGRINGG
jgi:ribosomal protein S6--L-glutamate ligase